ncbi:MAG TPA: ABC transporter ATP-binding protein, partial [Clostridiaceae bacterium]|nr:ABC transporter ATP-binding protein [Clostridiaceae bacterium]
GMMDNYQKSLEDMNNASVEYIRGISVVKAFRQTVYSFRRLHDTIKAYTTVVIAYTLSWENSFSLLLALINNIYLFVLPMGILIGMRASDYNAFASSFIFYLLFVPSIASVLSKVMYVSTNSMQILSGVEAMDEVLDEPQLPQPLHPKIVTSYDIAFEDVHFSYDKDKETEALSGVNFLAKQGEVTAIVGPSGGGKSTIAHLIPRFFDVSGGCITLGGVDVRETPTSYLMEQVSFVFQDVFLFKQSVAENIRLGNQDATDEQVMSSAKAARCHEFIMALPQRYDTVIGTRGVHLSGGERQRIAIARAIVKDAPVVVLDEATAFADPENEHLIQKAFETLMKNKTVIIIAHRLSTIRSADKIVVVEDGLVVEEDNHEALLSAGGRYAEMWRVYNETTTWTMNRKREAMQNA